jgi:hypothetical protein
MVSLGVGRLNEVRRGTLEREQRYDRKEVARRFPR